VRIALVSPYDLTVPGGVQSHVRHLAAELRATGDQVVLVGPGHAEGHLGVGGSARVPFNGSVAPIALGPAAIGRTRRLLARLRPDVVHVHEPLVPVVGLTAALGAQAPVVATFHAWSEAAHLYRLARPLGRRVLDRAAVVIAVSPAAAAYHGDALGVPADRFRIVPNGVEVARFRSARALERLADPGRTTLLFVGRLEPRKGLEPLVLAFVRLREQRDDLRLLVVGDGGERERCQGLLPPRLREEVVFLGRVGDDELPGCYAAADVYVSPALGGESFGIVLLEAMAAGTPVVASDLPGYRSVVEDGVSGRLVPPGDADALARAIAEVVDDPARRDALAAAGSHAAGRYDWPAVAGEVRACYLAASCRVAGGER
jgi:phosphatidyl-myo-inositol alpha-mannosyltransferase